MSAVCEDLRHVCGKCGFCWPERSAYDELVSTNAALRERVATLESWGDNPLPEDAAINAAFPTRSDRHDLYAEAMRLVGARRSKGELLSLVNWLLYRIDTETQRADLAERTTVEAIAAWLDEAVHEYGLEKLGEMVRRGDWKKR